MEFKKIGDNLELKSMVIHQLNKTAGNRNVGLKQAGSILLLGDKEQMFIGKLNQAYHKKSNPTYGIFAGNNTRFMELLDQYLQNDMFYEFSIDAAKHYKSVLQNTPSATGGFLIFIDFLNRSTQNRYLLVLTINNKDGYVVSEADLTIQDIKNLDLSKVDVACMINLTRWKQIEANEDLENKTYLSFVKGNKNVSYYFMSFIDCDNKTTNTESSKRLVKALDSFCDIRGYDRGTKIKTKNAVYDYCSLCMKEKREIQLSAISALFDPENPDEFAEFAADEQHGVSPTIKGDMGQLKRIKYISYKDNKYTLEFDADLLGRDIIFSKEKRQLTFKNLPDNLINLIPY